MAIKVVQGSTNDPVKAGTNSTNQAQQSQNPAAQVVISRIASVAAQGVLASGGSEAALVVIRGGAAKEVHAAEKIKDHEEAKKVADDVAEQIKTEEDEGDVHGGLDNIAARQHFSS